MPAMKCLPSWEKAMPLVATMLGFDSFFLLGMSFAWVEDSCWDSEQIGRQSPEALHLVDVSIKEGDLRHASWFRCPAQGLDRSSVAMG